MTAVSLLDKYHHNETLYVDDILITQRGKSYFCEKICAISLFLTFVNSHLAAKF